MSHFNRRNIFDVSCKVRSARPWDNIEKVCRRLLVKNLIKIYNINNLRKVLIIKIITMIIIIAMIIQMVVDRFYKVLCTDSESTFIS